MDDRCPDCGASFALVGRRHRCVPNNATTVPNRLKTGDAHRVAKWKAANKEKDRAYHRELTRKRRAAGKWMTKGQYAMQTSAIFLPLLKPSRYKGAFGGTGSGKSHFFTRPYPWALFGGAEPEQGRGSSRRLHSQLQALKESAKLLIEHELQEFDDLQDSR